MDVDAVGPDEAARVMDAWLRRVVGGRRFVIAAPMLQGSRRVAREVKALGASGCFLLAARSGGETPDPELGPQRVLGLPAGGTVAEVMYAADRVFDSLPADVLAEIDAFDPTGEALALGPFYRDGAPIAGRRLFGGRPGAWRQLEDKTAIDAIWDAADVPRAPAEIVGVAEASRAAARLDRGDGTVWAADARDGVHGAATHTFRVQSDEDRARAEAFMALRADRVRVMPFLEGIPCSVHGVVLPDAVVASRPAEIVILRQAAASGFLYMRTGTFWDPAPADREAMRALARRVGAHLRAALCYRGTFTVDGIMTRDGFRPTELNARPGAATRMVLPGVPPDLVHFALVEGEPFPLDPRAWEADRLAEADRQRVARLGLWLDTPVWSARDFALSRGPDGALQEHDDPDRADVLGTLAPGLAGAYATFDVRPSAVPIGQSLGPLAAELVAWCDAHVGSRFGPVTPARPVR